MPPHFAPSRIERQCRPGLPAWAKDLNQWWSSSGYRRYRNKAQFAQTIGVSHRTLMDWFSGSHPLKQKHRDDLYKLTSLECFRPEATMPAWVCDLQGKANFYIESLPGRPWTKQMHRAHVGRILHRLAQEGIVGPQSITPIVLIQHAPAYKNRRVERESLALFGRFLIAEGFCNEQQGRELEELLTKIYPTPRRQQKRHPTTAVPLVRQLVRNCGLSNREVRALRVVQIEAEGIRLARNRVIAYGHGWHQVSHEALSAWRAEAAPQDYLFYQRSPRDYHKPVSRNWVLDACGLPTQRRVSTRLIHFQKDFSRLINLRQLRLHLHYDHGISQTHSWLLTKRLLQESETFAVPEPWLPVVLCASRVIAGSPRILEGGKRATRTWKGLLGRYEVMVTWPAGFARTLEDERFGLKVVRALWRLAYEFSVGQHRIHAAAKVPDQYRDLSQDLAGTEVCVRDASVGWSGLLLETRAPEAYSRRRYYRIPLLEALQGGIINGRCKVCRHTDRSVIDEELKWMLANGRREKGFSELARKYGVPIPHVLWHAGRLTARRHYRWGRKDHSRVESLLGHLSDTPQAPHVTSPIRFINQMGQLGTNELVLFTLLLLKHAGSTSDDFRISSEWVSEQVGSSVNDHELSLTLNSLEHLGLIGTFGMAPGAGFSVSLGHKKLLPIS